MGMAKDVAGFLGALELRVERLLNKISLSECNPLYYLGAIGVFFFWVILGSGVYLFIFYDISAATAYKSVESITTQWYLGGVMRSLHRYASDGLVIVFTLHALRTFALGRHANFRWLAWVSGVVVVIVIITSGIFGYVMVWDEKAKFAANLSAWMFEAVPAFKFPLGLMFARPETVTDQFFYIVLFIHFSSLVFVFILLWIHTSRITKAVITPPRALSYALVAALVFISVVKPAVSGPAADLKKLADGVSIDWFYMFFYPLLNYLSPARLWLVIAGAVVFTAALPWILKTARYPSASVTLKNCVGCELCMEDCPYAAITMRQRSDSLEYPLEAVVFPSRCASCGLCVGACEYNAINLPNLTETELKKKIRERAIELKDVKKKNADSVKTVFAFLCERGAVPELSDDGSIKGYPETRVVKLPCIGMLQPAMLEIAAEEGVDGMVISGCRGNDCSFRTGNLWLKERLSLTRPPVVRRSFPRAKIKTLWISAAEKDEFFEGLDEFKTSLDDAKV